ncbi:MAG: hypothetical protein Q8927_04955 [Bacteroidota bacterium]|nr:hypothetical protein [Bacteroidota bacterium]MDP4215528.1 hypothetical protein [Bacteroidota bacterium]MDP4245467.1 hypothetical protein [Bacteroidota bacterium]MDP4255464.1 hypothetical protein [Bacteroidota bacterium]MDP4260870.1 hypothetical protein [Bacteroidota bacterium]
MKKLLVILFSVGLALGASAQRGHGAVHGGGGYVYHPRVVVGVGLGYGYGFGYGPYSPWGWYGPWGYPYPPYYYGQGAVPTRLALQISDIKNDYKAQIKSTRHDKTIPRSERRQKIRQLKHDRDQAIINARKDFYYNSRKNSRPGNGSNNDGSNGNGSSQNNGSNKDDSPYSN